MISNIEDVQTALNTLGYKGADGQPLTIDGQAPAVRSDGKPGNTYTAIKNFQAGHNLNVTGVADAPTMAALDAAVKTPVGSPAATVSQVENAVKTAQTATAKKVSSVTGTPGKPISAPVKVGLWAVAIAAIAVGAHKLGLLKKK